MKFKINYYWENAAQYYGTEPHNTSTETEIITIDSAEDGWTEAETALQAFVDSKTEGTGADIYEDEIRYYDEYTDGTKELTNVIYGITAEKMED